MNKAELITKMTENCERELTKKDVEAVLNSFMKTVEEALVAGDKIQLIGFGTFEVRQRASRTGKNPKTGEAIEIPACLSPSFKSSKNLKEAVNA
jgi:DNA-binding protein HU-beta